MSFFGFDTTLPRDRGHPSTAPGFGQAQDPFAGLSRGGDYDDDEGVDFEDTYDGLGDQLDEAGNEFNDDTFGANSNAPVKRGGKDFDFFGRTAQVSTAIEEEQMRYTRGNEPKSSALSRNQAAPARTGYEKYQNLDHVSDLQVDQSLWGEQEQQPYQQQYQQQAYPQQPTAPVRRRQMMSLEEIEAQMPAKKKPASLVEQQPPAQNAVQGPPPGFAPGSQYARNQTQLPLQQLQRNPPQQVPQAQHVQTSRPVSAELPAMAPKGPQILQRPPQQMQANVGLPRQMPPQQMQHRGPRGQRPLSRDMPGRQLQMTPQLLMQLSESERKEYLAEEARRAKRNHKIMLLSKDNGLMTPQDKNFITRIQLQQLMAASGNTNDQDPDAVLSEDFYYQVHRQIRGGPRTNPQQPLSHFAQTYLHQTGGRNNRRNNRGGDNHMQRMEQQVQRAVEAAKAKPKNKQLVIEGSLGKISFSNSKTPKPLLNLKRADSDAPGKARIVQRELTTNNRRAVLQDIENIFSALMRIEDAARKEPPLPPPGVEPEAGAIEQHMAWRSGMQALNAKLWVAMRVVEPIDPTTTHPFVAILSYPKGKKVMPRVFRHMSSEQRVNILTIIVVHLDVLDVVRLGQLQPGETQLPVAAREAIDLFSTAVSPSLLGYVSEAPLYNITGLLGLILDRVHVQAIAHTRVGLGILTMLTSRATLIREAGSTDEAGWHQWVEIYNRLFDVLEPVLGQIFPGSVNTGEDVYVWQFLAAIGSGASPEQQQRLVIAVKDRVMETVTQSKTLPPDMAAQRLGNVNLFMRAIGLDVELLG